MKKCVGFFAFLLGWGLLHATTYTVGTGGDYSTVSAAISAAANGDVIRLLAGNTFTITSTINVNKALVIEGEDQGSCMINPTNSVASTISVSVSGVTLRNFTVNNSSTSSVATAVAVGPNLSGVVIDGLKINTGEFGVSVRSSAFEITRCSFVSTQNDSHRFIVVYDNQGDSLISGNTWSELPSTTSGRFLLLSSLGGTFQGSLTVSNNSQGTGPLQQFLIMEAFPAGSHFSLIVDGNSYAPTSGGVIFYSTATKPLDIFSLIQVSNNMDSGTHGAGIIKIDGDTLGGPLFDIATDPSQLFDMYGNSTKVITAPNYVAAAGSGQIGYNSTVYNPFYVSLPPSSLSVDQYEIRFPLQGDIVQRLTWENTDPQHIKQFNIYQDALNHFVAQTGGTSWERHSCVPGSNVVYYVTSVDIFGNESLPASISVRTSP
jgi:hypothetical protein